MISHQLRVLILALATVVFLFASIFIEAYELSERVAGMVEGGFVTAAAGLWDSLKAQKRLVEVSDRDEKAAVETLRDSRRESVRPPKDEA